MKKLIAFTAILLIPFVLSAETAIKTSFMIARGRIRGFEFTIPSVEVKIEKSIYKSFNLGFSFRKETRWAYSGYYLSLYPLLKIELSKKIFWNIGAGPEYGLASSKYDNYRLIYNQNGDLVFHKWINLAQNASIPWDKFRKEKIGVIYPFLSFSFLGINLGNGFSFEIGSKIQLLRFNIKSCEFDPETSLAYNIRNEKIWKAVPSLFVQLGISFGKKKKSK